MFLHKARIQFKAMTLNFRDASFKTASSLYTSTICHLGTHQALSAVEVAESKLSLTIVWGGHKTFYHLKLSILLIKIVFMVNISTY